jgi:uncharacterized coiled-coil protein SlyX
MFLRQSTAQTVRFGPFVDDTDGVTAETGLTIAQGDMQLSKDGAAFAQKNASGNATHDTDGWYSTSLDTTDTNTVGELLLQVVVSGALPVWMRWYVVEEAIYDKLFAASGALNDLSAAQVNAEVDTALADYDGPTDAEMDAAFAALNDPTAAEIRTEIDSNSTQLAAIVADTNELQTDNVPGLIAGLNDPTAAEIRTEIDNNSTQLAAIVADTNELQTDNIPGLIAALNDLSAAEVNAQVADVIGTDTIAELSQGVPTATPTLANAIMLLYMMARNQIDIDTVSGFKEFYNNAGTVIWKKAISDDGSTYSEAEGVSGP